MKKSLTIETAVVAGRDYSRPCDTTAHGEKGNSPWFSQESLMK